MKINFKETLLRLLILVFGLTIAHFGVTLFILSNLGADTFNVLVQGIFRTIGAVLPFGFITHGNVHMAISLIIILVLLIVDRSYVKAGTIVCMLLGGPIIDLFTILLSPLFENLESLWIRLLVTAIACAILAFGMTIVIKSNAGTGPNDLVSVVLADKLKWKFSIVRVAVDIVFVLVGFWLGGTIGVGTIICAALVGPVAGLFLPINEKWINKTVAKFIK